MLMSPAGAVCGKWSREANIHVTLTHNNTQSDYMQTRDTQEMFTNHKNINANYYKGQSLEYSFVICLDVTPGLCDDSSGHTLVTCHEYYTAHDSGAGRGRVRVQIESDTF